MFIFTDQDLFGVLQTMHQSNYRHRDIKRSNIMFNSWNQIKLINFGLSTKFKKQHKKCGICNDIFYQTPRHMAPETIITNHYNKKYDMYSLGILIYEMLAEKQLYIELIKQDVKNKNQLGIFEIKKLSQLSLECQELLKEMLQMENFSINWQKSSLFLKDQNYSFMTGATSMHQIKEQKLI